MLVFNLPPGHSGADKMTKKITYQLSFEIETDASGADLMAALKYYAEAIETSLESEGKKADLVIYSERVEEAPPKNHDGYDGPDPLLCGAY